MFYDQEKIGNLCPNKRQIAAMEEWVNTSPYCSSRKYNRFQQFKKEVEHYWQRYPWLME